MLTKILTVAILAVALNGCGGESTTEASTPIVGLSVPGSADLITDNSGTDSSLTSSLTSSVSSASTSAFSDSGTDYSKDTARSKVVIGDGGQPMKSVGIMLCILNKTAQSTLVNSKYLAVLDINLCNGSGSDRPFMANMTVDTSRASNTSNQISKVLYEITVGASTTQARLDGDVKKEPTLSSPYGELELNYAFMTNTGDVNHGSLAITDIGNVVGIELTEELDCRNGSEGCEYSSDNASTPYNDINHLSYIDASASSDGTSGMAKVAYVDRSDPNLKLTYLLNWNNDFIAQYDYDTNDQLLQSSCKSRDASIESVENYTLYNVDGSRVNITTHVYGHYTDTSSNQKAIYVSKRNAWFEGGETGDARPTSMTTDDGTSLSISYDTDDSGNYDSDNDGTFATVIGVTLSDPIRFTNAVISGSNVVYNDGTTPGTGYTPIYMGSDGKYLWGIPSTTLSSGELVAKLNIKDGTQLTDVTGDNYILKQSYILKLPNTVNSSNCTTLTAAAVNAETNITAKTSADIPAIDSSWVTPDVGDNPKVIDGVIQ